MRKNSCLIKRRWKYQREHKSSVVHCYKSGTMKHLAHCRSRHHLSLKISTLPCFQPITILLLLVNVPILLLYPQQQPPHQQRHQQHLQTWLTLQRHHQRQWWITTQLLALTKVTLQWRHKNQQWRHRLISLPQRVIKTTLSAQTNLLRTTVRAYNRISNLRLIKLLVNDEVVLTRSINRQKKAFSC